MVTGVTRTVTDMATGESVVYDQQMGKTMYINIGIANDGHRRFFVDSKKKMNITIDEYEQLICALKYVLVLTDS